MTHMIVLKRVKALVAACGLAAALSVGAASSALAEPNDIGIRCESGSSGYCIEVWVDNGVRHATLYWFSGNQYCILFED
jgi:hypothetical protein